MITHPDSTRSIVLYCVNLQTHPQIVLSKNNNLIKEIYFIIFYSDWSPVVTGKDGAVCDNAFSVVQHSLVGVLLVCMCVFVCDLIDGTF